jgi:hypothetical protein
LWEKIPFMRMPKTNEHGDVFLRVRIYEKCSYHNHKTIKQHSNLGLRGHLITNFPQSMRLLIIIVKAISVIL